METLGSLFRYFQERTDEMEIWKPLKNFPSYEGSTEGRIRNIRTRHILTPVIDENGYAKVTLRKDNKQYTVRVHRIIADTFFEERPELDVRHKDLNRSKNRIDNLEQCTRSETIERAYKRGTKSAPQPTRIRVIETGETFESINECSRQLGCNRSTISKCLAGKLKTVKGYHLEEA